MPVRAPARPATRAMRKRLLPLALLVWSLGGCVGAGPDLAITTTSLTGASERIPIAVSKPDGAGPFPADIRASCGSRGLRVVEGLVIDGGYL